MLDHSLLYRQNKPTLEIPLLSLGSDYGLAMSFDTVIK